MDFLFLTVLGSCTAGAWNSTGYVWGPQR